MKKLNMLLLVIVSIILFSCQPSYDEDIYKDKIEVVETYYTIKGDNSGMVIVDSVVNVLKFNNYETLNNYVEKSYTRIYCITSKGGYIKSVINFNIQKMIKIDGQEELEFFLQTKKLIDVYYSFKPTKSDGESVTIMI